MQSHSGDASSRVKVEVASQTIDVSNREEEEELSSGDAPPKVEGNELNTGKLSTKVKEEANEFGASSCPSYLDNMAEKPSDVSSLEEDDDEVQVIDDPDGQICDNASNQLVVYDPEANGMGRIESVPEAVGQCPSSLPTCAPNTHSRVLPSVGAFTVQCANCFKWRLIPTKGKYEEIRETILERPFFCERAREWRPNVCCDDPADILQDGSRLWAIDKPNIAQPPPGWERLLRIRGEGSTRFADVYYVAPSGKRLRSMVEIQKFLLEHPEYIRAGVTMSQFSFQIPKPLQENYVRKRPRVPSCQETQFLEPTAVHPISWVSPDMHANGGSEQSTPAPYFETAILHPSPPAKRRATSKSPSNQPSKGMYKGRSPSVYNQSGMKVDEPAVPGNSAFDL